MRRIAVVVASLLCSLLVMSPGVAAKQNRLTLEPPVQLNQATVRLSGLAPAVVQKVNLQRQVDGRWVRVAQVRVVDGRYRAEVSAAAQPRRYRAVAGFLVSGVRTVSASRAPVEPEPEPEPVPVTDACGTALFRVDGTRRLCTFADNFDGAQLDRTKWLPQGRISSGELTGAYACYRDHPDNISVSGGALQLTVRQEPTAVACDRQNTPPSRYTAGGVSTYRLFSQAYGRFEARMKTQASTGPGLQEAFWLWPDDRQSIPVLWPEAGEIDIVETYSGNYHLAIPFLHYTWNDNGGPRPGLNTAWDCAAARGVWNTYALEWTPNRLEIFVNGKSCLVNTTGNPAFQRKYIVALTSALGVSTNRLVPSTPIPATMSVDYVHVWE